MRNHNIIGFWIFIGGLIISSLVQLHAPKYWVEQSHSPEVKLLTSGQYSYIKNDQQIIIDNIVSYHDSPLTQVNLTSSAPQIESQWVKYGNEIKLLKPSFHFGIWSLFPAFLTVMLCLLTREPLTALLTGIISGAIILGNFDLTDAVLIPNLAKEGTAALLLLYLWLLGGLLGIWSKTGAAQAFAHYMTEHFVTGPKSAKLISWLLGVLFFQGGTMSTVLVGTTVKPLADKAKVSHEEMSYIVDSTASPIASVIAFNAWPAYIQALIFVPGVTFLATEQQRLQFFFASIPFSFYGILAVLGTLLLSLNVTTFAGKRIRQAQHRAATTGELDSPNAKPLSARELQQNHVPEGYAPHHLEFIVPLVSLILIAISTFMFLGTPKINWAFAIALSMSFFIALYKGMSLFNVMDGFATGLKGVVFASVILMLAITVGSISKEIGAGLYLVSLLGDTIPYFLLPVTLQLITMVIAFSTGTSWGTYAIAFPLSMPLVWAVAMNNGLDNPEMFMMICFATVLNGSVYGDQCSPISDTTILSSMTTGCDLMDHVKSQIVPATFAALVAAVLWTLSALILA